MTLVKGIQDHQAGIGARTHVLVIGVGRYPHLLGGSDPKPRLPALGQLTSPPVSARAIATWFTSGKLINTDAPLGSVELLLSDAGGQGFEGQPVETATSQNIQKAFDRWKLRCDGDPDNVAIFYFCGHGLQKDVVALLPENFGESANNPWLHAINFTKTYDGMAQTMASTQYFIVDACRQLSSVAITDEEFGGFALITPRVGRARARTAPRLFANAEGLPAFGDSNNVSRLTAALLRCLNDGVGATEENNAWIVDTLRLGVSVQDLINYENERLPDPEWQLVDPAVGDYAKGTRRLHVLPHGFVPEVIVNLGCKPDLMTEKAVFYALPEAGQRLDASQQGRWETKLPAGLYVVGCLLDRGNGAHSDVPAPRIFIKPPVWRYAIDVPSPPNPA